MKPVFVEFYIYAHDADHALEMAGHAADTEFPTKEKAIAGFDEEFHSGRSIFRVIVEKIDAEAVALDSGSKR